MKTKTSVPTFGGRCQSAYNGKRKLWIGNPSVSCADSSLCTGKPIKSGEVGVLCVGNEPEGAATGGTFGQLIENELGIPGGQTAL